MNTLFPIFLNLEKKLCTVIGGGSVALRKILGLLECQAVVRVIAPVCVPAITQLCQNGQVELFERMYQAYDIAEAFLVVAATDDHELNTQIAQECAEYKIFCNIVDTPELCSFYYASVYTCGDLKIAISTNGISPALAKKIKAELAAIYTEEYIPYLHYLQKMREIVKEKIAEESQRKKILERIVRDSEVLEQYKHEGCCRQLDILDYTKELEKWL